MSEQEAAYRGGGESECEALAWEAFEGIGAGWRGLSTIIIGLARTVEAQSKRIAALEAKVRRWIRRDEERARHEWETHSGRYARKEGGR